MKILVLGATSFLGGWFCKVARKHGHDVQGLGRPWWDLNEPVGASFLERQAIERGHDNVVNYAALNVVADSWRHAADYYQTNVVGITNLAERMTGVRKFVQISTPEVYGSTESFLKEGAPHRPSTPYAVSRSAADRHLELLHRQFGFPVTFTRTVNVYGEGQQSYRVIPKVALSILRGARFPLEGGGWSTRSFLHAEDMATATLAVLERGRPGATYHIAHPGQVMIRDLVAMVCESLDRRFEDVVEEVPDRRGKDMAYQLDDKLIRAELGWGETIALEDGIRRAVAWMVQNRRILEASGTDYRHVA